MGYSPRIENRQGGNFGLWHRSLSLKFHENLKLNWQRYRDLTKMAPLRHWAITQNCKLAICGYWFVAHELKFEVS